MRSLTIPYWRGGSGQKSQKRVLYKLWATPNHFVEAIWNNPITSEIRLTGPKGGKITEHKLPWRKSHFLSMHREYTVLIPARERLQTSIYQSSWTKRPIYALKSQAELRERNDFSELLPGMRLSVDGREPLWPRSRFISMRNVLYSPSDPLLLARILRSVCRETGIRQRINQFRRSSGHACSIVRHFRSLKSIIARALEVPLRSHIGRQWFRGKFNLGHQVCSLWLSWEFCTYIINKIIIIN